jgi:hypothetical protein
MSRRKIICLSIYTIYFPFSISQTLNNEPQFLFNVFNKSIDVVNLENVKFSFENEESQLVNTTNDFIGEIEYIFRENLLVWRKQSPLEGFYVAPIDKR